MKSQLIKLLLVGQCVWLSTHNLSAQATGAVYSLSYTVPAALMNGSTKLILNRGDLVLVRASGKATYGPFAAGRLGWVDASGSPDQTYRTKWNKPAYARENFGTLICRIGANSSPYYPLKKDFRDCLDEYFSIGACAVSVAPVAGALIVAENDGELIIDVNDAYVLDNIGGFKIELTVITSSKVTQLQSSFDQAVCSVLAATNINPASSGQMLQIAQGIRSPSTLTGLRDYNGYYNFLNAQTAVQNAGIRWQQVAIEVTGLLLVSNALLDEIKRPSWNLTIDATKLTLLVSYLLLTTKYGENFFQGIASKDLLEDVNRQFYVPLIRGEIKVINPFWFDAAAVYAEQFNFKLQGYYQQFGTGDKLLIEGAFARWFAKRPGCYSPSPEPFYGQQIDIGNPMDRVKVGLYKMGYSRVQINQALNLILTYQGQRTEYNATVMSNLKNRGIVKAL